MRKPASPRHTARTITASALGSATGGTPKYDPTEGEKPFITIKLGDAILVEIKP